MPAELPPRPGPKDQTLILHRRPKSGFVNYPPFFQKRMVDGRARFMTKCDMLIGPCACGYTHTEWEGWVVDMLDMYNAQVEVLILWGEELGDRGMVVEIPGYWKQGRNWERPRCDVLVGQCVCGRTHATSERWVATLLTKHRAVILNMPEVEATASAPEPPRSRRSSRPGSSRRRSRPRASAPRVTESSGTWVREPEMPQADTDPAIAQLVDDVVAGEMALPPEVQTRLSNSDATMPNCDCSDCEHLRERELVEAARAWVRESVDMSQASPCRERSEWEVEHSNALGYLPGWCNCDSCLSGRVRARTGQATQPETEPRYFDNSWWVESSDESSDESSPVAFGGFTDQQRQILTSLNSVSQACWAARATRSLSGGRFWVPPPEAGMRIAEAEVDLNMEALRSAEEAE